MHALAALPFRPTISRTILNALVVAASASPCWAQCGEWETPFGSAYGIRDSGRYPFCVTDWDPDGAGPEAPLLVFGGQFFVAGGATANKIVLWDGTTWRPLGDGMNNPNAPTPTSVQALISWDMDGDGPMPPQLVAGGDFSASGDSPLASIARWDGTSWHPIGTGFTPGGGIALPGVSALILFDFDGDGPVPARLVAGGNFARAGDTVADRAALWDGSAWQPIGGNFDAFGSIKSFTSWDPDGNGPLGPVLVAAGSFNVGGTTYKGNVARWDGSSWIPMGNGFDKSVDAIRSWDPDGDGPELPRLIAGGQFQNADGAPAKYIVEWTGTSWNVLGGGLSGRATCLDTFDPDGNGPMGHALVVAGTFDTAGGTTVNSITRWDGTQWSTFGGGAPGSSTGSVLGMKVMHPSSNSSAPDSLVICGDFSINEPTGNVLRAGTWDGTHWRAIGTGLNSGVARVIPALDSASLSGYTCIAGGTFRTLGLESTPMLGVAGWTGSEWSQLGSGLGTATSGSVRELTYWSSGGGSPRLIAAGGFVNSGAATVNRIASWDGTGWQPLGTGLNGTVQCLCSWDPDGDGPQAKLLVAGGDFTTAGGSAALRIAVWNGTGWSPLGAGFDKSVSAVQSWDPDGDGPQTPVLVAGGSFTKSGSSTVKYLARWTGSTWQAFDAGPDLAVQALMSWDPDGAGPAGNLLVAGGLFTKMGGASMNAISAWNGASWLDLGGGFTHVRSAVASYVDALSVLDVDGDGPLGPQLIAGGEFVYNGDLVVNRLARWDGAAWHAFGGGATSGTVTSMCMARISRTREDFVVAGMEGIEDKSTGGLAVWNPGTPEFMEEPDDLVLGARCTGILTAVIQGSSGVQWQALDPHGAWSTVLDGTILGDQGEPLLEAAGAQTDRPTLTSTPAFASQAAFHAWRCIATNPCGATTSREVRVDGCGSDFDCSGVSDLEDSIAFIAAFEAGTGDADFDGSGFVDTDDFTAFVLSFEAGC